jgi:predicted negative regulator of RcsB-dependent stress response
VSVHLSEEEQLEVLKRWWKEYGMVVVGAVVAAIVIYFAWTAWQDKQRVKSETASAQYESLTKLLNAQPGKALSEADRATAEHIAGELKDKNGSSLYAQSATFFLAKLAVDAGNLDKAVKELQWILAAKPDLATAQLAHVRLARVLVAKESYADALAQLNDVPSKAFASEYSEVRGDILKAQGNRAAALTAYEKAIADADPSQQEHSMVLQMKADELKVPTVVAEEKAQ